MKAGAAIPIFMTEMRPGHRRIRRLPYSDPEDYNDELWVWGDDWNVYGCLYDDNYFIWAEANIRDENYAKSECAPE